MDREAAFDGEEKIHQVIDLLRRAQRLDFKKVHRRVQSAEFIMLSTLWDFRERGVQATVSQIKEQLHVTPSAVTNLLRVLENKGLIRRQTDSGNRRQTFVFLTEEGACVFREELKLVRNFSAGVYREMGARDSAQAIVLLEKLVNIMENELRKPSEK
ncbi:MAG TPA: MarR family transcriptional regulator [Oscillospiraceae bacterium]|nr:MarR family transcriptional regulator [Oscillospiraceae bacterium]HXK77677.1 MarR family transcriptional regulator [Oscillospiraceae bacterium]